MFTQKSLNQNIFTNKIFGLKLFTPKNSHPTNIFTQQRDDNLEKDYVAYEIFKEFLLAMGMASKCFLEGPSIQQNSSRQSEGKRRPKLFHENNSDLSRIEFLIIPSLINQNDERKIPLSFG